MALFKTLRGAACLDDIVVAHYAQLLAWAQQFVGRDKSAAEDLVQDTLVRVALRDPDFSEVQNVSGYLFVTMRNVYLSEVRRRRVRPVEALSLADYESAAVSLLAAAQDRQRQAAYDELTLIVQYACLRKATSKAASALILRFFHGYYPAEIARILHGSQQAVDVRLRFARTEARAFVAAPNRLRAMHQCQSPTEGFGEVASDADFVSLLRERIFDARVGDCPTAADFEQSYGGPSTDPLDTRTLAHLVSCRSCLDAVNRRFGFSLLKDRDPSDMLGRGRRSNGPPPGGSGGAGVTPKVSLRTRLKDTLDDRPAELRIAVNGLFVGSQTVTGGVSEQRVRIFVDERVGFIEVFSEHDVCLLYMDVTPPPDGAVEQSVRVELSDGRWLAATLTFREVEPSLEVIYRDPAGQPQPQVAVDDFRGRAPLPQPPRRRWLDWIDPRTRLKLAASTSTFVICTLVLLFWTAWDTEHITPASLLRGARVVEASALPPPGIVSHRLLMMEERVPAVNEVVRRQNIEIWGDGTLGIQARRVYDENWRVMTGLWVAQDGTRTVYRVGEAPEVRPAGAMREPITARDIWTRDPSAENFLAVVDDVDRSEVDVRKDTYVVTYRPDSGDETEGLVEARLVIDKANSRVIAETIVLREDQRLREFTFSEVRWERIPRERVTPTIFEPDAVLLNSPPPAPRNVRPVEPSLPPPVAVDASVADRLELDVIYRLFRSRLWVGQQAHVRQTSGGSVAVVASVSSEEDKQALRAGFDDVESDSSVSLDVEIESREPERSPVIDGDVVATPFPAYPVLVALFDDRTAAHVRDDHVLAFSNQVLEIVDRRRERLEALRTLVDGWPAERLRRQPLQSIVAWQVMVQAHADAARRDTELLHLQLSPVFRNDATFAERPASGLSAPLSTLSEVREVSEPLFSLAALQDETVRAAFRPCPGPPCAMPDGVAVGQSFVEFEELIARFARFYLKLAQ